MGKVQQAVDWAVRIASDASHGYDQAKRWGPDYDCSSLIISAYQQAGIPVKTEGATYTGNMIPAFRKCGFSDVVDRVNLASGVGLVAGDVLLHPSHAAMYIGAGRIVVARINERGTTTGGATGDQTGNEITVRPYYNHPWTAVLRFGGQSITTPSSYTVKVGDTLFGIALANGTTIQELVRLNGITNPNVIAPGQVLLLNGGANKVEKKTNEVENIYTVKSGDTLWGIAAKQLGSGFKWTEIARKNGIRAPYTIRAGQKLEL